MFSALISKSSGLGLSPGPGTLCGIIGQVT